MTEVKHLGSISIDAIAWIRATGHNGKRSWYESRDDIQAFLSRYGNVIVARNMQDDCYHSTERLTNYASIVVKVKE